MDLLRTVREFNGSGQHDPIDFRVGIATGSVVAGVVGIKRFLFDMWYVNCGILNLLELFCCLMYFVYVFIRGDAVNVAAR